MAILSAMAPALIMTQSESHQLYEARLLRLARLLCWMAIIMALLLSICSRQIIVFLYGPSYAAASPVLAIHAWAGVFVALGVAAGPWFVNGGFLRFRMMQTLIGAVVNIAMNIYMIPHYGIVGAACSTLVSQCVSAFLINAVSQQTRVIFAIQAKAFLVR
jgi:PST family polysaccharide transporter